MDLKTALDAFYYSTVLCDLRLMNKQFVDETLTYNSLLYLELIFSMKGKCTACKFTPGLKTCHYAKNQCIDPSGAGAESTGS